MLSLIQSFGLNTLACLIHKVPIDVVASPTFVSIRKRIDKTASHSYLDAPQTKLVHKKAIFASKALNMPSDEEPTLRTVVNWIFFEVLSCAALVLVRSCGDHRIVTSLASEVDVEGDSRLY